MDGVLHVLRHGFKHRGIAFRVCYFMPESELNQTDMENYEKNIFHCIRQWHYSADNANSVDMLLAVAKYQQGKKQAESEFAAAQSQFDAQAAELAEAESHLPEIEMGITKADEAIGEAVEQRLCSSNS